MKKCPFAENEYCVENNCSLWDEGCLVRQALIRYIKDGNEIKELILEDDKINPNETTIEVK